MPALEIDEHDPFHPGIDLLDREGEIKNLTPIVLNFAGPLVFALDSPSGSGKTTFVRLWQAYLKQQGYDSIYLNAWETDFAEDPLIVLLSELNRWLQSLDKLDHSENWQKGIKRVLPDIVKSAKNGDFRPIKPTESETHTEFDGVKTDIPFDLSHDLLINFENQSKANKAFKNLLAEALDFLPDGQKNLIIFIDELDCCRPTYAIQLLERLKHLFRIPRLVFVLSSDTTQLAHSIRAVYGDGFDAKKYLQRFIDMDYSLKIPEPEKFIENLFHSLGLNQAFANRFDLDDKEITKNCILLLASRFNLTARDINLLLMRFRLILHSVPDNHFLYAPLLVSLLILRDKNKFLYHQYESSPSSADKVIEFLFNELLLNHAFVDSRTLLSLCRTIGFLIAPNNSNPDDLERLIQPYKNYKTLQRVIEFATDPDNSDHKLTLSRIELFHQFSFGV